MVKPILVSALVAALAWASPALARGGGGGHSHGGGSHSHSSDGHSHASGGRSRSGGGSVHVGGYTRKNGTHVAPHMRSAPDGSKRNNWSTKGNINPYTGKAGTKNP